jgi:diamine N-acetyltransferase
MPQSPEMFDYLQIPTTEIDRIGPLWEQLRDHHRGISTHFSSHYNRPFADRKVDFVQHAHCGKIRIELVRHRESDRAVAYCVSTLTREGAGEVDSLFVLSEYRGCSIGSELSAVLWPGLTWSKPSPLSSKLRMEMMRCCCFMQNLDFTHEPLISYKNVKHRRFKGCDWPRIILNLIAGIIRQPATSN